MASGQSYPSPNAAQVAGGAGPFYGQNGPISPLKDDSTELRLTAELSRHNAPPMGNMHEGQDAGMGAVQHTHTPMRQPTSPQAIHQDMMGYAPQPDFGTPQDLQAPDSNQRKRSKVSRACDECRRKKIRCDATSENGPEACSSCKRTGARCCFSRQPMKRGPSKGYIKELADRLNNLEATINPQGAHQQTSQQVQQHAANMGYLPDLDQDLSSALQEYSPASGSQYTRKRTHTESDGYIDAYPPAQRVRFEARPNSASDVQYPINGLPSNYSTYENDTAAALLEWNEVTVDEYYRLLHPTLPFLPHSKAALRGRLARCPPILRDSFLAALDSYLASLPSGLHAHSAPQPANSRAPELADTFERSLNGPMSYLTGLVYTQVLILLALEADNHGPDAVSKRDRWLARAVAQAFEMNFHKGQELEWPREGGPDDDGKIDRRVFIALSILDRWWASGRGKPMRISQEDAVLLPEDRLILGETVYHLTRLSLTIGELRKGSSMALKSGLKEMADQLLEYTINQAFTRLRENINEAVISAFPLVHLCYWHVRLLITRSHPGSTPQHRRDDAFSVIRLLVPSLPFTPLNYHCVALAATTLTELADREEMRDDAIRGLDEIDEAIAQGRGIIAHEGGHDWASAMRDNIAKKKAQLSSGGPSTTLLGLQHLADAAVAGEGSAPRPGSSAGPSQDSIVLAAKAAATAAQSLLQENSGSEPAEGVPTDHGYLNTLT